MDACGCEFFSIFDRKAAQGDVERYRKHGPDRTTRLLLDLLRPHVTRGSTILDVGSGIGVIDHELLRAGARHAVLVDAAQAYLDAARDEASRRQTLDRIELVEGNFVRLAPRIDAADIVTLDRVVCCYPDAESLVGQSVARARSVYGLVLPRDGWHVQLALRLNNFGYWLRRSAYRAYVHPNSLVDRIVAAHGLVPRSERTTWLWRVVVYGH
jgi:magnesium-protoporphyrin O-methyltransferase